MFDHLIRDATLVDGTGSPARRGSVGIRDGRIVAVIADGTPIDEDARRTTEADGRVLAPGFIDPHTHYDAQFLWDPYATPSSQHGVTTVIGGNCGFTLAPLADGDGDYTRRMMAKVEGMPLEALEEGMAGAEWDGFAEYLDHLDGRIALNAGFLVGHCAIRRRVMGTAAVGGDPTPAQLDDMVAMLHRSIEAGGLGFSTTLSRTHSDGDGQPVASRWAERSELLAFARAVSEHEGTTLEYASDGCLDGFDDDDVELMIALSTTAARPLNWNVLTVDSNEPERYRNQLAAMDRCAEAGARVVALTMPVLVGMNMSFLTYCALNMMPDWGPILGLPLVARKACLRDPEVRAFMAERAASPDAGVFSRLTGWGRYVIGDTYSKANDGLSGRLVSDIAAERGRSDFDTLLDIVLEDDLATVLWPGPTDDDDESWRLRAEAWDHPAVMIGGSDAGAHLDRMAGAPYTTMWLEDCLRGRRLTTLENAVRHLTDVPARLFGLRERGRIEEGFHADLVLFDPESVGAGPITLLRDLPGDNGRLVADAIGVSLVMVGGVDIVVDGVPTGDLPGQIIRSGADTYTVSIT